MKTKLCNTCKQGKKCPYYKKAVSGYTIFTSEHCCKKEVETTRLICASSEFGALLAKLNAMTEKETDAANIALLLHQMNTFKALAENEIISI